MKKGIFIGLFIFSVALNIAGLSTIAWNLWISDMVFSPVSRAAAPELSPSNVKRIRNVWGAQGPGRLRQKRIQILEKKRELLDIVAKDPNNETALQKTLDELVGLRGEVEKEALNKIRHIAESLPEEERRAFLDYLRGRACMGMGPGMGMRRGRGRGMGRMMMRGPQNCPGRNQ